MIENQTIGIDLDEVTISFIDPFCKFARTKNVNLYRENIKTYNYWEAWGGTPEELFTLAEEFYRTSLVDLAPPIEGAISAINTLAQKNKIVFVTSRFRTGRLKAELWLKNNFPNTPYKLHFAGKFAENGIAKSMICKEEGISVIIDDFDENIRECIEKNPELKAILFGNYGWTKQIQHARVKHASSWSEVLNLLQNS